MVAAADDDTTRLPAATRIGTVRLVASDLERSASFYERRLGLRVHGREGATLRLGAGGEDLLVLDEIPRARPARGTTGLYHFALLVPSRLELARALRRLAATRTPLQGASDHGVSEALYLADPDRNGIEIYRDRPRPDWPFDDQGVLAMTTLPLDTRALLAEATAEDPEAPLDAGTTMGHVHLHVADLAAARHFYVAALGFETMQRYGPSALFVSAGGYHHHVGLNTWQGEGAPPPPADATGLRWFELLLPDDAAMSSARERLAARGFATTAQHRGVLARDPAGNGVLLTRAATGSRIT